jgi:CheY-like chemotaxis protein
VTLDEAHAPALAVLRAEYRSAPPDWYREMPHPSGVHVAAELTVRLVLVVDDNVDAADSLADLIEILGHRAEVAYDGPSAIQKARACKPDVVLCDIGLPGMSGYDVARALRAEHGAIRLVAASGYAQPEDVARALEAGFDAHLAKPPDPRAIERLLK